jgi:hypothetical protein
MSRIVIVGLTTLPPSVSRLSAQCEILNISQPYRPPRPVRGIAFTCTFFLLLFLLCFSYFADMCNSSLIARYSFVT